MFAKTKIALAAAIVLGTAVAASAATKPRKARRRASIPRSPAITAPAPWSLFRTRTIPANRSSPATRIRCAIDGRRFIVGGNGKAVWLTALLVFTGGGQ